MKIIHTSGQRKQAVARATLKPGSGIVRVNSQLLTSMPESIYRSKIEEPLLIAGEVAKKVDITVRTHGGGVNGQAEAARMAIAKAIAKHDSTLQSTFIEYDRTLLVADIRRKESRKPNCQGSARSKRQKSYR